MTVAKQIADALRPLAPGGKLTEEDVGIVNQIAAVWAARGRRRINAAGLALIKEFEGCRLQAYRDPVGIWTVGYGSTGAHVKPGLTLTEAQCEALLQEDLARFEQAVERAAPKATDNQFAAMVALAFNIGITGFGNSTVLRKHRAGDHKGAADAFKMWNKAGGRVLAGLTRRRAAEADLYRRAA